MRRIAGIAIVVGLVAAGAPASASPSRDTGLSIASHNSRHADAVAEAKRLLRRSPTTASETRVPKPPRQKMRSAPEIPEFDQLVTRSRFWKSNESLHATYAALKNDAPAGMRFAGSGGGLSKDGTLSERFANFALVHLPRTIASAMLTISVVRIGHGHSAVGAYAQVVPRPRRHPNEHVPRSLRTVTVAKIDANDNSVIKQRTVEGGQARVLVRDFDALLVEPPGAGSCTVQFTARRATFTAEGHTWQVQDTFCGVDSVTRDGDNLADLVPDKAFTRDLKAALR